jgi:dihydrofolate reductase
MRQLVLLEHTSLDGFVAGPKGEFDGFEASEENLLFVCQLARQADTILSGRITFELLDGDWPTKKDRPGASEAEIAFSNWYNGAKKIVISKTLPQKNSRNVTVIGDHVFETISGVKQEDGKDILVFGSPATAQSLMGLGLVDSYWIFVNPVIFGEGIPLFTRLPKRIRLRIVATRQFENGELAINYVADHSEPRMARSRY